MWFMPSSHPVRRMDLLLLLVLMVNVVTQASALSTAARTPECRVPPENPEEVLSCYGCLGEPLYLYLANDTAGMDVKVKKVEAEGNTRVQVQSADDDTGRTLMLGVAQRGHQGRYQLDVYNATGNLLRKLSLVLEILAPVSEPALSLLCLSGGKSEVTCSSEGDRAEFSWSLDNQSLAVPSPAVQSPTTQSPAVQSAHSSTITLEGHLTGNLICDVENVVSSSRTTIQLSTCTVPSLLLVGVAVALTVAALLVISSLSLGIRHCIKQTRSTPGSGANGEDIVYTEVRVVKRTQRKMAAPSKDDDPSDLGPVTYGLIKMADSP